MANTEISKGNGGQVQRRQPMGVDVFTTMRNEMDRMFERFEHGFPRLPDVFGRGFGGDLMVPELDVHDDGRRIAIDMDLPGVDMKDVTVTLANGLLTIKGEKKSGREEKKGNYYVAERSSGTFERSLRLPDSIDEAKLEACFDKGVLQITAPKRPEAVNPEKRIEIKQG